MKKFNSSIKVEVSVDAIANNLLNTIDSQNPHRELIAETVISLLHERSALPLLHNSLLGFKDDIDVEIGKIYLARANDLSKPYGCDDTKSENALLAYRLKIEGDDEERLYYSVKVIETNIYRNSPYKVCVNVNYIHKTETENRVSSEKVWADHKDFIEITPEIDAAVRKLYDDKAIAGFTW